MIKIPNRGSITIVLQGIPREFKQVAVDIAHKQIIPLAPRWLKHLSVIYETNTDDALERIASMDCQHEYREAKLFLYPEFFLLSPQRRQYAVLHELVHMYTGALEQFTDGLVMDREEAEQATISRLRDVAVEITVDDISELLGYMLKQLGDGAMELPPNLERRT